MAGILRAIGTARADLDRIVPHAERAAGLATPHPVPVVHAPHDTDRVAPPRAHAPDLAEAHASLPRAGVERTRDGRGTIGAHAPSNAGRAPRSGPLHPLPSDGDDGAIITHRFAGRGTPLITTPQAAHAIALGAHQIDVVAGAHIDYPSQDLRAIESADPHAPGQTHVLARHVGSDLAANVARLRGEPHIRAAGGYTDEAAAQFATDATIANPANQKFLADFLADGTRSKDILFRVDLGRVVGTSTLRRDLLAGHPRLIPATCADVVVVKDASFPEGYRVLTSYPEATRPAEVDARGNLR